MIITPILIGGFGNRLYQIANALRLCKLHNANMVVYKIDGELSDVHNLSHLIHKTSDLDEFGGHPLLIKDNLPTNIGEILSNMNYINKPTKVSSILENKKLFFEPNVDDIESNIDSVVMGYYFGYRFIKDTIQETKKLFNPLIESYINTKYSDLLSKRTLGIHLRLGIPSDNNPAIHIPYDFYKTVFEKERSNIDVVCIVSDNVELAKEYIVIKNIVDLPIVYIEQEPMYIDMLLLSKMDVLAIAPSTLSAWSTYFSNSNSVYVPKIWTNHHWTSDISDKWILI